jgi:hypothetical protein
MSRLRALFRRCRPWLWLLWLPLSLLWVEAVVHVYAFHSLLDRGILFISLFSLAIGLVLDFVCCMGKPTVCRRLALVFLGVLTFWCMVQTVYFQVSTTFLTLYSVGTGAGPITQFWRVILMGILRSLPPLLLEAIPMGLLVWRGRRSFPGAEPSKRLCRRLLTGGVLAHVLAVVLIYLPLGGLMTPRFLYRDTFIPQLTVSNFGVMTTLRLDAQQLLFDKQAEPPAPTLDADQQDAEPSDEPDSSSSSVPVAAVTQEPVEREYQVLDIDFDALAQQESDSVLSAAHSYFGSREATAKNQYTGMWAGKNLIYITAESFSPYAIDPALTPTLYKLAHSGFQFEHFYTPLWWVSTSDGEYVNCQSLIPKAGTWSMRTSGSNTLPFTLGNQFRSIGYSTYAYHDHYWDYYGRDISHPNMGYDYKGRGHGLDVSDLFPESDVEMMELSIPEYVDQTPFHVYYMTVSGHMNYTFVDNDMSIKHRDEVSNLEYKEETLAYLACNIELDRALEALLDQLDQAGILEDTVICLTPDHYPYGLDKSCIDELAGHEVEENFELYESTLILWAGDMDKTVTVTKPCSSLDILPTLSNLFGLEYDSRLLMGRDILSDSEGLVVFSNRSFLTEHGSYNALTDEFTPYDDEGVPDSYARSIMDQVNDMFYYSAVVLDNDYYALLGLSGSGSE